MFPLGIVVTSHNNLLSLIGTVRGFSRNCVGEEVREDQRGQRMGPRCLSGVHIQSHKCHLQDRKQWRRLSFKEGQRKREPVEEARYGPVKKREIVFSREEEGQMGMAHPFQRTRTVALVGERRVSMRFLSPGPADTRDASFSGWGWGAFWVLWGVEQQLCPHPLDARSAPPHLSPDNKHVPRHHPVSPGG